MKFLTCSGRDSDKASDHSLDGANDGGLLEEDDVQGGPSKQADGSCQVRVQDGSAGIRRGGVRITTVEAIPSEPEDTSADQRQ